MNNVRLIHLSTDCVFSGKRGHYVEDDIPDPLDLYGRSKLLGEVGSGNALTIRTSMIGSELGAKYGLLEWFLSQRGKSIKGYTDAIFSGFTTIELCRTLKDIIVNYADARGLYHLSSEPISKFDLLMLIKDKMRLNVDIVPDAIFQCDRSLDSTKFRKKFNYTPPTWKEMIDELVIELRGGK
jgi:dTDP-4-dehydrorhamnose reductase